MKKLALSDEILLSIQEPGRYIGCEGQRGHQGSEKGKRTICLFVPDVYEIGSSHLGMQILYSMFNKREDICCERVYSPWVDLDAIMREKLFRSFTLESQGTGEEL